MSEYFYTQQGQQKGPISQQELQHLAQSGQLQPADMVWKNGMPNWAPANTVQGLFPNQSATPSAPALPQRQGAHARGPARRPASDWDDDEMRPRRPARQQGMNKGLLWGLIGGGVALVLVIVLIVVLVGGGGAPSSGERSFSLASGRAVKYSAKWEKGQTVLVTVNSKGNSDVDLFIYDSDRKVVVKDISPSSNCRIVFVPSKTETYQIEVQNRVLKGPPHVTIRNGKNSGTVKWRVQKKNNVAKNDKDDKGGVPNKDGVGPGPGPIIPGDAKQPPFKVNGVIRPGPTMQPGNKFYLVYAVQFEANRNYTISVVSQFDNFLIVKDATNKVVGVDDDGGQNLNARLEFRPPQAGVYRVYVTSFRGRETGPFVLSVQ